MTFKLAASLAAGVVGGFQADHALFGTVVQARVRDGAIIRLSVTPVFPDPRYVGLA